MSHPGDRRRSSPARLVTIIGIGMLVATLANGTTTYLKRVGLIDGPSYKRHFSEHCTQVRTETFGRCCVAQGPSKGMTAHEEGRDMRAASAYLFEVRGGELLLKLAKDVLALAFIAISLYLIARGRAATPSARPAAPLLFMAGTVSLGFLIGLWNGGDAAAIAGLRPFQFLAIALLASWSVSGLPLIATWAAWALVCQLLILPYEWLQGMPLRFCPYSLRAAGTLVLPNSLGAFAVTTLAFGLAFVREREFRTALFLVTLLLVIASGSATGLVALVAIACFLAINSATGWRRILVAAVSLASISLLVAALPDLTGRADLFRSLLGSSSRLEFFVDSWQSANAIQVLVGHGLGNGANVSASLGVSQLHSPDSALAALFAQLGLLGVIAFYFTLAWGFRQRIALRPFFLAVAVCSLTLNVIELFPLTFLLGLALAACLAPLPGQDAP